MAGKASNSPCHATVVKMILESERRTSTCKWPNSDISLMARSCVSHFIAAREALLFKLRQEQVEPLIQAGELFSILQVAPDLATRDILAYDGVRESFD